MFLVCSVSKSGRRLCPCLSLSLTSFWFATGTPVSPSSFSLRLRTAVALPTLVTASDFPRKETCSSIFSQVLLCDSCPRRCSCWESGRARKLWSAPLARAGLGSLPNKQHWYCHKTGYKPAPQPISPFNSPVGSCGFNRLHHTSKLCDEACDLML